MCMYVYIYIHVCCTLIVLVSIKLLNSGWLCFNLTSVGFFHMIVCSNREMVDGRVKQCCEKCPKVILE